MSSPTSGLTATLLMFVPLLAVPLLAAFGVSLPVATMQAQDEAQSLEPPPLELDVGESLSHPPADLQSAFGPPDSPKNSPAGETRTAALSPFEADVSNGVADNRSTSRETTQSQEWVNPFAALNTAEPSPQEGNAGNSAQPPTATASEASGRNAAADSNRTAFPDSNLPEEFPGMNSRTRGRGALGSRATGDGINPWGEGSSSTRTTPSERENFGPDDSAFGEAPPARTAEAGSHSFPRNPFDPANDSPNERGAVANSDGGALGRNRRRSEADRAAATRRDFATDADTNSTGRVRANPAPFSESPARPEQPTARGAGAAFEPGRTLFADGDTAASSAPTRNRDRRVLPQRERSGNAERGASAPSNREIRANNTPTRPSQTVQLERAVQRLRELGIQQVSLQPNANKTRWHFSCLGTSPVDPRVKRRFEAEAAEKLTAIQDVIRQIEVWRNGR